MLGSLRPEDQPAHSVPATILVLLRTAWAAGGYVLISSVFGLVGRLLHWAPAYSFYYCANVFGLAVCLVACALPVVYADAKDGFCLTVERACLAVDTAGACPFTVATGGLEPLPPGLPGKALAVGAASAGRAIHLRRPRFGGYLRGLAAAGDNTSPCCYAPDVVDQCSEFLGAAFTQAVVAAVLAALVITQSVVSCFYLCCDCDRGACPRACVCVCVCVCVCMQCAMCIIVRARLIQFLHSKRRCDRMGLQAPPAPGAQGHLTEP